MRTLAATLAALGVAGCTVTVGRDFDSGRVAQVRVGEARRAQIEQWFGPPYQRTVMAPTEKQGVRRYVYAYAKRALNSMEVLGKSLVVDFDTADAVVDFRYTEEGLPQ